MPMQLDVRSLLVPIRRNAALLRDAFSEDAAGDQNLVTAVAVTLGLLVVCGVALLLSVV